MVSFRLLALALLALLLLPSTGHGGRADGRERQVQLAAAIEGRPAVATGRVYWVERAAGTESALIAGYDSVTRSRFVVKRVPGAVERLAAGGATVAWLERTGRRTSVQVWDASSRRERSVVDGAAAMQIAELAVGDGTLLYAAYGSEQQGIWALDIDGGRPRRQAGAGAGLVAHDGWVLWSAAGSDAAGAPEWTLQLLAPGGGPPRVVARSPAPFSGYDVAGGDVVWSSLPPAADRRVRLLPAGAVAPLAISAAAGRFPRLHGRSAVWTPEPGGDGPALAPGVVEVYDLRDGRRWTSRIDGPLVAAWGFVGERGIVWTDERAPDPGRRPLWLSPLAPADAAAPAAVSAARSPCGAPLTCGQLRKQGPFLYDAGGRLDLRGVQFFLPELGINTWTFYDRNYWSELEQVDGWLDVARYRLRARLLRIFVELPDGEGQPTAPETVYDFAQRAGDRGMRLGIVVQNSSDFAMTPERRAWLDGLLAYFGQRGATPLIAYINAANEINNWCSQLDCFDNNQVYLDAAVNWTAEVVATVKGRDPAVLTTVGLSSEVRDADGVPAVFDYFKRDTRGRSLADTVDFLSPHNYAGGAYGVWNDLRNVYGYGGPIVLEEFGWSTDPLSYDPRFTEGAPSCVNDPLSVACRNTGPYFVELSVRALRDVSFAGGVAWMLADVEAKSCGEDPSDLWSGLFAAGAGYCGGTRSTTPLQGKATAGRVALFFADDDLWRLTFLPRVSQ